jgi:hypothetical protein
MTDSAREARSPAARSGPTRSRPWLRFREGVRSGLVLSLLAAEVASVSHGSSAPSSRVSFQDGRVVRALERYASGQFDAALDDLTRGPGLEAAVRQFRKDAAPWIDGAEPVERPWRLAVTGTVAIELVALALDGKYNRQDYNWVLRPLVEWTCRLLRRGSRSEFERVFRLASIGLMQGARDEWLTGTIGCPWPPEESLEEHILRGAGRFPAESRFKLAWVLLRSETRLIATWTLDPGYMVTEWGGRIRVDPPGAMKDLQTTLDALGVLIDDAAVGHEAKLRRGVLRFLMGQSQAALPDLHAASRSADPFIQYLSDIMMGVIAEQAGRDTEAVEHYRAAVRLAPAQAATLALAAALFRQGRGTEAADIVSAWAGRPGPDDPWRLYGLLDYRLFPRYRDQMREMIRR